MTKTRSGKSVRFADSDEGTAVDQGGAEAPLEAQVQPSIVSEHTSVPYIRRSKRLQNVQVEIGHTNEPTEVGVGVTDEVVETTETQLGVQAPSLTVDSSVGATTESVEMETESGVQAPSETVDPVADFSTAGATSELVEMGTQSGVQAPSETDDPVPDS